MLLPAIHLPHRSGVLIETGGDGQMKDKAGLPACGMSNDAEQVDLPGSDQTATKGMSHLGRHSGNPPEPAAMVAKAERIQHQIGEALSQSASRSWNLTSDVSQQRRSTSDTFVTHTDCPQPDECLELVRAFIGIQDQQQRQRCLEFIREVARAEQAR
jgi:hypothetical protein